MTPLHHAAAAILAAQDEIKSAIAAVGTKYGLTVSTRAVSVGAKRATLKLFVTAPATMSSMRRTRVDDQTKIMILDRANPYKRGSKAYATFSLLKRSKTVGQYRAAVKRNPDKYQANYLTWCTKPHGNQLALIKLV